MKIDQLSYFRETARQLHLGRAGAVLGISSSAISHSIAALEEELGHPLFERVGKRLHLTEHGKLLAERIDPVLEQLEALRSDLSRTRLPLRGFYKVASAHQISPEVVGPACFELQDAHPEARFEIQTFRSALVLDQVLARQVDLGICYSPQEHPDLGVRELHRGALRIVVRSKHPLLRKPPRERAEALSRLSCAMAKPSQGIQVCETHPMFEKHGIRLNSSAVLDNYELLAAKVRLSDCWGFLPEWAIALEGGKLSVVELPGSWDASYTVAAIWHRRQPPSRGIDELIARIGRKL